MSLFDNLTKDEIVEIPMIDIMYHYLNSERKPIDFYTIMDKIAEYKGWSEKEKRERIVQAYTDMNIDGRFVSLGDNKWGLKSWYPVEQTEEELATTIKPKKRDDEDFDDIDDDLDFVEEDIEEFVESEDGLGLDDDDIDELDIDKIDDEEDAFLEPDPFEIADEE